MPRIVLASQSTSRRRLLEDAGLKPTIIVSNVDEETDLDDQERKRLEFLKDLHRRAGHVSENN